MTEIITALIVLAGTVATGYFAYSRQRASDKVINAAQAKKLLAEAELIRQEIAGKERERLTGEIERLDNQIEELRAEHAEQIAALRTEYEERIARLESVVANANERSDKLETANRALVVELSRMLDSAGVEVEA